MAPGLRVGEEVAAALAGGRAVVALESTISSTLGLPEPANQQCVDRASRAVRSAGAVPALTGVLDGCAVVGTTPAETERLCGGAVKLAAPDLGPALACGLEVGVTTVSAALTLASKVGIEVLATGGIGGVHRGAESSGDVSHDLPALSRHPLVTVSSGAKAFLDLPRTVEHLEMLGVPVLGWKTDRFAGFYIRDGGIGLARSVAGGPEVAAVLRSATVVGHRGGVLVVNPIPADAELDPARLERAIAAALAAVRRRGLSGGAVTPMVLAAVAEATEGDSVTANLALSESNAAVAAEIALALTATSTAARS